MIKGKMWDSFYKVLDSACREQTGQGLFKGMYNVSIVGMRSHRERLDGLTKVSDKFEDQIVFTWDTPKGRVYYSFTATTLAGMHYYKYPMNPKGTAQLKAGQIFKSLWKMGKHNGYTALVQSSSVKVYRDNNKDRFHNFDEDKTQEGRFGLNLHIADRKALAEVVNKYSAGCQVVKATKDEWASLMKDLSICEKRSGYRKYSYFLLEL